MKFNRKTHEKERIINLIQKFYETDNLELETIIYGIGCQHKLTYHNFVDVYQRLLSDPQLVEVKPRDILNINFEPSSKYGNIRATISGEGSIKNYCSTNSLKNIGYNVKYTKKKNYYFQGNKIARVDVNDYHIRFNLKEEEDIPQDSTIIKELLDDWNNLPKIFRRKQTHTFVTQTGQFHFDLSIVKQSNLQNEKMTVEDILKYRKQDLVVKPKDVRSSFYDWWKKIKNNSRELVEVCQQPVYYKKIENSNVFTNPEEYEIEIELHRDTELSEHSTDIDSKASEPKKSKMVGGAKNDIQKTFSRYIEKIGIVLQSIQRTSYIISESHKKAVINEYQAMIKNYSPNLFKGPLPVTLERKHIKQHTNREYQNLDLETIRKNYVVTEKANGERCLLFVDIDDKVYLITRTEKYSQALRYMGCTLTGYRNTLLDGEYVTVDMKGNNVSIFIYFDIYYIKNKDIRHLPFGLTERLKDTRQYMMNQIDTDIMKSKILVHKDSYNDFVMYRKKHLRGDSVLSFDNPEDSSNDTLIFESSGKILSKVDKAFGGMLDYGHLFSYEVDGLIFTPANLGVGQNYQGDDVGILGQKPWLRVYKWKPPQFNSIDFHVKIRRNPIDKEIVDEYYNGIRHKHVFLQVSYHPQYHNDYYAQRVLNEGLRFPSTEQYVNFEPIDPFYGYIDVNGQIVNSVQISSIVTNNTGDMLTLQGEVIQEGNVVEFIYDVNETEERFKWKPLKIREGKKANGFHTAINVWRTMKNPITTEMIMTGVCPSSECYYNGLKSREEYQSRPMKTFHNYVKNKLLQIATEDSKDVILLDLCCGKLGDMKKWLHNKVKFVVAVDNSADNIHDPHDGAASRIIAQASQNPDLYKLAKNTMIILGDCSQNLSNGSAGLDLLNKYYLNVLYGNQEVTGVNTKLERVWGTARNKFDIITCHFGIHYFFKDLETLENYMVNIAENLKSGGKFIGTCFDGETLFKALKTSEVIEGYDNSGKHLIWRVRRKYSSGATLPHNHYSLGHEITTYFESINQEIPEYLVNFDFLVDIMNKYGLQLLDSKLFDENPTSFYDNFKIDHPKVYDQMQKQKTLKQFSSMNRWFIFTKTKNKAMSSIGKSMFPSSLVGMDETSRHSTKSSNADYDIPLESEPVDVKLLPEDVDYNEEEINEISEYNPDISYDYNSELLKQPTEHKSKTLTNKPEPDTQPTQPTKGTKKKTLQDILDVNVNTNIEMNIEKIKTTKSETKSVTEPVTKSPTMLLDKSETKSVTKPVTKSPTMLLDKSETKSVTKPVTKSPTMLLDKSETKSVDDKVENVLSKPSLIFKKTSKLKPKLE
jgi:hypothetical protein